MHCDERYERRDCGIYTVRVQGQVHYYLGDLIPHEGSSKLSGLQFYFYDPEDQVSKRISALPRLDNNIMEALVELMANNPYSVFLKQVSTLNNIEYYAIVIRADPYLDQRRYNKSTCSEVAGIWIEDESGGATVSNTWDIRVYTNSGHNHRVRYYYGCYDPLQYVIMFPNEELGWHGNILRVGCHMRQRNRTTISGSLPCNIASCTSFDEIMEIEEEVGTRLCWQDINDGTGGSRRKRNTVSCKEYYVYKIQEREGDRSHLLHFGRLFQQYVIDNYIKLESMRLDYLRNYQKKLRHEHYQGVMISVISGVKKGCKVGKRIYLLAIFISGPRNMRHRYLDSMALVQEYGRPDIFLTMTCNPNWPEIQEHLLPGEEAQNRPDLVAQVFKAKLSLLHDKIMSGKTFGKVASVVYVVEFQKRGLPHAHFLIILKAAYKFLTPDAYDRFMCVELPDKRWILTYISS